jgi:hypothetical protein
LLQVGPKQTFTGTKKGSAGTRIDLKIGQF